MRLKFIKKIRLLIFFIIIFNFFLINLNSNQFNSFDKIFEKDKEIFIRTENLNVGGLYILKTDFYNNLLFLDATGCQLILFNQEGVYLKRIGEKGQGPGEFIRPFGLGIDTHGNIILSDGQTKRINKYDKKGNFISSFICSGMHWPPHIICIDSHNNYFFGGFKINPEKPYSGEGMYINKYHSSGKYENSFFPRNTSQLWFLSLYPFFSFDMNTENKIFSVQMNKYEISVFDPEGNLLKKIGKVPDYFKPPDPNIEIDYSQFKSPSELKEKIVELSKSWTKILCIKVIKDKYLLLVLEMKNLIKQFNKIYVLDIWDKEGKLLAKGIQTDYKFLCVDKEGYVYFLIYTDEETTDKNPEYKIGKFKFKLDYK